MTAARAYIGVGANLGDRQSAIRAALADLDVVDGIRIVAISPLIETDPVGPAGQPRYINAAAAVRTNLTPRHLLDAMHAIEAAYGRDRRGEPRWGPRRLDLDLLLYDDLVLSENGLTVPHPRLHERAFVLEPLAIIAPGVIHPILGVSIECLRDRLAGSGPEYATPPVCC